MAKRIMRNGDGVVACTSSCLDVLPGQLQRAADQPVLGSIENLPVLAKHESGSSALIKKQFCLSADQTSQPVDVSSVLAQARAVLRQPFSCSHAEAPIAREQEYQTLTDAFSDFISTGSGGSLYVSGLPGTGKSHTVRRSLHNLVNNKSSSSSSTRPLVTWINCMSVSSAGEVYARLAATAKAGHSLDWQHQQDSSSSYDSSDADRENSGGGGEQHTLTLAGGHLALHQQQEQQQAQEQTMTLPALLKCLQQQQQLLQRARRTSAHKRTTCQLNNSSSNTAAAATTTNITSGSSNSTRPSKKRSRSPEQPLHAHVNGSVDDGTRTGSLCLSNSSCPFSTAGTPQSPSHRQHAPTRRLNHHHHQQHICVLDEVDNIAKRSLSDLVQLFQLPHQHPSVSVLVVGIANSIDLTERTLPELQLALTRPQLVTFSAYTQRQLADILESVVQQLPHRLFEPTSLQVCCRSIAGSTGDLRHALKACRAAIDELEQQQQQQQVGATHPSINSTSPGTAQAPHSSDQPTGTEGSAAAVTIAAAAAARDTGDMPVVGPRHMAAALSRLAGVRSSQFVAQAASSIRNLPNQQQLLLYSLAVLTQQPVEQQPDTRTSGPGAGSRSGPGGSSSGGPDGPATPGGPGAVGQVAAGASSLWKSAGSAAVLGSGGAGGRGSPCGTGGASWSGDAHKRQKRVGASGGAAEHSVFVLAVTAEAAYKQYLQVCQLLKLPPCTRSELLHMADLLAQMALLDVIHTPATPSHLTQTGGASPAGFKATGARQGLGPLGGVKRFKPMGSKLGGLGGGSSRSLGGAAGKGGGGGLMRGSPALGVGGGGQQGEVKLCLRASSSEVYAALKHNPALRCLLTA